MKSKQALAVAALAIGAGVVVWQGSVVAPAAAGETTAVAAVAGIAVTPAVSGEAEYVGSNKCRKCHFKVYRSWKKTPKHESIEKLLPGKASEAKAEHGLDTSKDYTQEEGCVKCHVTGYGEPGGYAMHDINDKDAHKKYKNVTDISCESCHGPGSTYIDLHEEIMKEKREYTQQEMYEAGMTKVDESTCAQCHNDESPTSEGDFNFSEMKEKVHEHEDLKYRKG